MTSAKPQLPVEKGCWILIRLYGPSWQGGATRWVHDARLVRLTAALPLSPRACNLYILTLHTPPQHWPQDRTLPQASVYMEDGRWARWACVCVCLWKSFPCSSLRHSLTMRLPPCESLRCGKWANRDREVALALWLYLPSNWSKMVVKIPD